MAKIDKLTAFAEVKSLGVRWIQGNKTQKQEVIEDLVGLRRPKGCLYPALVHRFVTKELGFEAASKFAHGLLNEVAE